MKFNTAKALLPIFFCTVGLSLLGQAQDRSKLRFRPLVAQLQAILDDEALSGAVISARVDSLSTGRTVFAFHPDQLVNPASVTKIFTTSAALCLLHPEYHFRTEIYGLSKPSRGILSGPLFIKGEGDPSLVSERLALLAMELRAIGIRKIEGPIVLDDMSFADPLIAPGYSQDSSVAPYEAPMGALSLNFNSVSVLIQPGDSVGQRALVELLPDSEALKLTDEVTTGETKTHIRAQVSSRGWQTQIDVSGSIKLDEVGFRKMVRVSNPTYYTGYSLLEALRREGIDVGNIVRRGQVPARADLLYVLSSPSLSEIVRTVNKISQNFMAEQLYLTLGRELAGSPTSYAKSEQVLNAFYEEEVGFRPGSYILHNGSGLNDTNRVSASHAVSLLRYIYQRPDVRSDFLASMAVAGADGTVAWRFRDPLLVRAMRLKTGTLYQTRALAGYVQNRSGETFAFSLLVSRYPGESKRVLHLIDLFAANLAYSDSNYQVIEALPLLEQAE